MQQMQTGSLVAGKYRLEARLDEGGAAEVWKAQDDELKRDIALKILLTPEDGDPSFLDAFRAEAQAEAALKHPSIVEVFDWGHDGDANFVVMELLGGHTVRHELDDAGPVDWPGVLSVGRQLASALSYAHSAGVAHGNLDATRVVLSPDRHATVIGFGLSCRVQCETPPSPDADTFALGGLLYEMLTGASPFGPRPAELPTSTPWPQPVHQAVGDIPHELGRIVDKAIAADPSHRYTTAAQLEADLDALARPKSRAWLWASLAVAAIVLAAVGTWYVSSQQKVVVPDVKGKTPTEAATVFSSAGLKMVVAGQQASTEVATGTVLAEVPAAGESVRKGAQVGVTTSKGLPTVSVPSVVGIALSDASAQIANAGLSVGAGRRANSTTYPVDMVISSFPEAGTSVIVQSRVDLVVSAGQATVTMPDVRGSKQADAAAKLKQLGLVVDVGKQYSTQPPGSVVSQAPDPGTKVPAGGTAVISVSQGQTPVKLPDLVGSSVSVAKSTLLNLGLVPLTSVEASGTHPSKKGVVLSQNYSSGSLVAPGTRIRIVIGN